MQIYYKKRTPEKIQFDIFNGFLPVSLQKIYQFSQRRFFSRRHIQAEIYPHIFKSILSIIISKLYI